MRRSLSLSITNIGIMLNVCCRHIADMELSQWVIPQHPDHTIHSLTSPSKRNTLDVDLTGPFLLCKAYLQALRSTPTSVKDTASICFIGSTAGKFGEANHGDYAAAKSALVRPTSIPCPSSLRTKREVDVRPNTHSQKRNHVHSTQRPRQ